MCLKRRNAAELARHRRDKEGLSIAEIARRLGRAKATVKAYLYDPSDGNKGHSREREVKAGGRELRADLPAAAPREEKSSLDGHFFARSLAVQDVR